MLSLRATGRCSRSMNLIRCLFTGMCVRETTSATRLLAFFRERGAARSATSPTRFERVQTPVRHSVKPPSVASCSFRPSAQSTCTIRRSAKFSSHAAGGKGGQVQKKRSN